ncbi:TetR/AcrR family transcriptional regulator [Anaerovorax odorimutans]|uniref:TetR/AcrR family transcriptional regulator n=1 Tax=Anaerovorax odorimutans TaxID=109327 RepID=A0ABT1RSA0_9FIRM|nr:TetR/AcrR family transcriptional regulator [Anaerovorax odorimutans]MCQ4638092.1 TetR/AcrR family transcriptional regulator [Anaerovorax odorimutans]
MEIKKQHILEAASELFLEKGYTSTSMQDVAEGCNVSKATLYKFFQSKESLGIMGMFYLTGQMTERVEKVVSAGNMAPRDILRESIIIRMERCADRNRFIDELLFSLPQDQRENYLPAINKSRFDIFELFSGIIMKAFGLENETIASELTLNLNGLIKEITFIAGETILELDERKTADFIIDSLEAIMEKRRNKKSLMTEEQLTALRKAFCDEGKMLRSVLRKKRLMGSLRGTLDDYEKNGRTLSLQEAEAIIGELKQLEESEEV